MVVVWICALTEQPQTRLEIWRPHARVELPTQLGLGHGRLVLGRAVHKREVLENEQSSILDIGRKGISGLLRSV
jgi:hypothetical protein